MSACQDRKVIKDIWLLWSACVLTCTPIFVMRYPRQMVFPQIRIYDTSKMGFKLVQTIEAQVNAHILSYLILSPHIASYLTISYHQDVGWSVLDVALSPDGGHLVYSSWSDSLHQVPVTMISFSDQNYHHPTRDDLILIKIITRPNGQSCRISNVLHRWRGSKWCRQIFGQSGGFDFVIMFFMNLNLRFC